MRFESFSFGTISIDGVTYDHDVVIDHGKVRKRKKGPSKPFREAFGHTPLSIQEDIPWNCSRLVVGTGTGARGEARGETAPCRAGHPADSRRHRDARGEPQRRQRDPAPHLLAPPGVRVG